jgi:hypothetical protein
MRYDRLRAAPRHWRRIETDAMQVICRRPIGLPPYERA